MKRSPPKYGTGPVSLRALNKSAPHKSNASLTTTFGRLTGQSVGLFQLFHARCMNFSISSTPRNHPFNKLVSNESPQWLQARVVPTGVGVTRVVAVGGGVLISHRAPPPSIQGSLHP